MATRGGIKGFYRQKKSGGIAKSKSKPSPPAKISSASFDSDLAQAPALVSHGSLDLKEDHSEFEEILRQFDMNMAYGPCIGMSRMNRWERAEKLGLNPPKDVERLLKGGKGGLESLWDGRV